MVRLTVTDIELERIFRRAYELGESNGAEKVLIELGLLSNDVKKTVAVKKLGSSTYKRAVARGFIKERKLDPTKKNSTIVVSRKELNYIEKIMYNPSF